MAFRMGRKRHTEQIFVANAHPSLEVDSMRVRMLASQVMRKENRCRGKVNIILATDTDLKDMNTRYLGRDRPTDVLAFSMGIDDHQVVEEQVMGEIYVSLDRAQQQAREYKVTFAGEVDRLVIHGLLHLCGYDHEKEDEAKLMRAKEDKFLEVFQ